MKRNTKKKSIIHSIFTGLLICLVIMLIVSMCFFTNSICSIKKDLSALQIAIENGEEINSSTKYDDYTENYVALSEKADIEMERLVSIVGILATVYTVFGALIVFKAPHEIDKRMSHLDKLNTETNEFAQEARYQAEIIDSVVNDYNGDMTNYDKLCRISKVIDKYPNKPDAYIQRGFIYDGMGKYDEAISDYKTALKFGCDKSTYYGNMGIALNKKGELKKALSFYTKAINLESDDAVNYVNRGSCYDDMHEYNLAISDYSEAINLDDGCKEAYKNRSLTYRSQMLEAEGEEDKNQLYEKMILDLQKALEIDPDDKYTKILLRNNLKSTINPDEMIAKIDERIGDLELDSKNYFSAFKQYIESIIYYLKETMQNHNNYVVDIKRLISKLFVINSGDIIGELSKISNELNFFCQLLRSFSINLYISGDKTIAEKSFILLSKYDNNTNWAINLAFMKRRSETTFTELSVFELLNICEKPNDAIWCLNKALAYISGADNHEINWNKAIETINNLTENIDLAIEWWSHVDVVGEAENNVVDILLTICKKIESANYNDLDEKISKARIDGYFIPKDI